MMRKPVESLTVCIGVVALVCCGMRSLVAGEAVPSFDLKKATARNSTLEPTGAGASVRVNIKGGQGDWAGIELAPAAGAWNLSGYRFVVAEARVTGGGPVAVRLRIETNAASFAADGLRIDPSEGWTWIKVGIRRPADAVKVKMFGMVEYPWGRPYAKLKTGEEIDVKDRWWANEYPWGRAIDAADGPGIDPAAVARLVVFVDSPREDCSFEVRNIRAAGTAPSAELLADPAKFFPCIDEFGQYVHADWPGKIKTAASRRLLRAGAAGSWFRFPPRQQYAQVRQGMGLRFHPHRARPPAELGLQYRGRILLAPHRVPEENALHPVHPLEPRRPKTSGGRVEQPQPWRRHSVGRVPR